ncbi:MAG: hypothetical protein BAJATHORv1_70044 [Candidatus Thorarchaeota archaeon]|nr:MAG: hypothetical protein BAJATHORv1_70044 [Candidatus Thorarchaeota archaeon]
MSLLHHRGSNRNHPPLDGNAVWGHIVRPESNLQDLSSEYLMTEYNKNLVEMNHMGFGW